MDGSLVQQYMKTSIHWSLHNLQILSTQHDFEENNDNIKHIH